jgi:hypothetical protein
VASTAPFIFVLRHRINLLIVNYLSARIPSRVLNSFLLCFAPSLFSRCIQDPLRCEIFTMRATLSIPSLITSTFFFTSIFAQYPQSPKRGLVSVSTGNPGDDQLFIKPNNGLTWYYNYGITPTSEYINLTQSDIEFVPMLWGASNTTGSSFLSNVTSLIAKGRNITHVLGFNEPDVNFTASGSQVSPDLAAVTWIQNFDPLRKMGIKVGAPVVLAAESGFTWLDKFYAACKARNSSCEADFMNIHIFGNISYVKSYLDEYKQKSVPPSFPLSCRTFADRFTSAVQISRHPTLDHRIRPLVRTPHRHGTVLQSILSTIR